MASRTGGSAGGPDRIRRGRPLCRAATPRTLITGALILLLACAAGAEKPRKARPKPKPQAAPDPAAGIVAEPGTLGAELVRLLRTARNELSERDVAQRGALEWLRAVAQPDADRAVALVDAAGYQALPSAGPLPDQPERPVALEALKAGVVARPAAHWLELPAACCEVVDAKAGAARFAAAATWMLPSDWLVVLHPVSDRPDWLARDACIVVRVRGDKPWIMGGTFLEELGLTR